MRCARRARRARRPADAARPRCRSRWSRTSATRRPSTRSSTRSSRWCRSGSRRTGHGHGHGHEDLSDDGHPGELHALRGARDTPEQGHDHGKPVDIREYFDPDDLAQQYNLHQEANKIDLAAMTDEIVFSKDGATDQTEHRREGPDRDRPASTAAGMPGDIADGVRAPRSTPTSRSPSRRRCWAGCRASRTAIAARATRTTRRRCAAGSPACSRTSRRRSRRHLEPLMALEHRVVEAGTPTRTPGGRGRPRRGARAHGAGGVAAPARADPARRADPQAAGSPRAGASTPAARCGATCASTASRSPRSP